jgi:hypothetical protein
MVKVSDSEVEIIFVSVAAGLSLEQSDLSVHDLQFAGTDGMFIPIQDKRLPHHQFRRGICQNFNSAGLGFTYPCL